MVHVELEFVRANTVLAPVPFVPELSLYQADEPIALWEKTELNGTEQPPPFWAFAWAGGQAVARYLLDHPDEVRGRTVLDIASGSGLVAIAAMLAGANVAQAAEPDPMLVVVEPMKTAGRLSSVPSRADRAVTARSGQPSRSRPNQAKRPSASAAVEAPSITCVAAS